ncbi:hypothetical protein, partial [Variovorax defluvii]|uniref:hypothetical protein n=1 Tax=Variovorax defluvii TaxID=913761 RepID=UPI0031E7D624
GKLFRRNLFKPLRTHSLKPVHAIQAASTSQENPSAPAPRTTQLVCSGAFNYDTVFDVLPPSSTAFFNCLGASCEALDELKFQRSQRV